MKKIIVMLSIVLLSGCCLGHEYDNKNILLKEYNIVYEYENYIIYKHTQEVNGVEVIMYFDQDSNPVDRDVVYELTHTCQLDN